MAREAENGEVAINLLSEIEPACIISDICMPVKDGFHILKFIRRRERRIPVILIPSIPFDWEELFQLGAKEFIQRKKAIWGELPCELVNPEFKEF